MWRWWSRTLCVDPRNNIRELALDLMEFYVYPKSPSTNEDESWSP